MNVYDFDGTIYSGDSTLDFYIFELRRNKKIIRALPIQVKGFIQYLLGFQTKTKWKEKFFSFFSIKTKGRLLLILVRAILPKACSI